MNQGEAMTVAEAESLTTEIKSKLDSLADIHDEVMPLILRAIEREAYKSLGYKSQGAYVSDRFGGALARLGQDMRRDVVYGLTTKADLSPAAIAPIVDVDVTTVRRDLRTRRADARVDVPETVTGLDGRTIKRQQRGPDPELVAKRQAELEAKRAYEAERQAAKQAEEAEFDAISKANIEARGGALAAAKTKRVQAAQERINTALNEVIKTLTRALNDPGFDVDAWRADNALPPTFRIDGKEGKVAKLSGLLGDLRGKMAELKKESKSLPAA